MAGCWARSSQPRSSASRRHRPRRGRPARRTASPRPSSPTRARPATSTCSATAERSTPAPTVACTGAGACFRRGPTCAISSRSPGRRRCSWPSVSRATCSAPPTRDATWTRTGCCATDVDPGDPARLLGRDDEGALARSTDGGATWQAITPLTGPLTFNPTFTFDGPRVWASSSNGAVSFSDDFGTTWHVAAGIPEGEMVATTGVPGTLWIGGLRSTDFGANWLPAGPVTDPTCVEPAPVAGQPLITWALDCGAVDRTTDGGATWSEVVGSVGWAYSLGVLDAGASAIAIGLDGPWLVTPGQPPSYRGDEPAGRDAVRAGRPTRSSPAAPTAAPSPPPTAAGRGRRGPSSPRPSCASAAGC